jgi:hypothetical protein
MLIRQAAGLMLLPLLLGGCASMTETECKVADWGRVGLADGARGEPERRLATYAEDCAKTGVTPNTRAYRSGWDEGISRFCTPANGWREGLEGHADKAQVCIGQPGYEGFSRYLNAGIQVYRTQQKIRGNTQEINRLQKKLEATGTDDEKRQIRRKLQDIDQDQYHLRALMGQQQLLAP